MGMKDTQTGAGSAGPEATDMVKRAAEGAHVTIDRLAQQAGPAVQKLQEQLDDTGEMLHERADQMREMGRQWREGLRSSVREHPLTTIVAALALGALLARLSR
ncbi:MAG TPA: hypothetical protein VK195_07020 [Burkholderiaceae bacterium]|nr:hypothetical protein [Burkholderiaceae bacterium]